MEYQFTDSLLDRIVVNFKRALKAKQRALRYGKYEDINEFRQRVEYNETLLTELNSDALDLSILEK
jgi:hypothetical protein